jgi:hypothetical protein
LERIFILDEILVKAGQAAAYRSAYCTSYVPGAERRGMRLEGAWQSPPARDYDELPATLYFLWSVEGVSGWWRMRLSRKEDGSDERFEKLRWWQASDGMTISRKRSLLTRLPKEDISDVRDA